MQMTEELNRNIMYDHVKEKIVENLSKQSDLKQSTILEQIEQWKKVIVGTDSFLLQTILGIQNEENIRRLSNDDWKYLQRELEESFVVRIETGILVTGEEQRNRDRTWWTGKKQLESDNYYETNYKTYMKKSLPPEVLSTIDTDTNAIMDNLADPDLEDFFSIYGMVVGHVQSGKTSNYSALISKAADAGYRFIVVIAGGLNNLRNQTQGRLDEVFVGANYQGVGTLPGFKREKIPVSLTNAKYDFKVETAKASGTTNFENMELPIIAVIKKHPKSLENLLKWLNIHYKNKIDKAMLVIDDESDYASINTKNEDDPTVINEKIRLLLGKFKKSAYVAYTATPYANIFIDHEAKNDEAGKDLFPRDFIYALDAPSNYFGAEKIFGHEDKKYIVEIPETEAVYEIDEFENYEPFEPFAIKHKKNYDEELVRLPESLKDAVRLFLINIAIRNLRNQRKHNSMLIHVSRFTNVHVKIKKLVEEYFTELREEIKTYGKIPGSFRDSDHIRLIEETFNTRLTNIEFEFETLLNEICKIVDFILVRDVHQKAKIPLEYRNDIQSNVIVIGGLSLARGFTLEGLSVSYFLRTTIYYDTLMQMGRWFGYRIGYEDICRVYLTDDLYNKFSFIIDATNDLITKLNEMRQENLTPNDFGLAVQLHPDSLLQVTARNKSKYTEEMYLEMSLDGLIKETRWISNKQEDLFSNADLLSKTVFDLQLGNYDHSVNKSHIWRNVNKGIIQNFIENYQLYKNDPLGIRSRMPIEFIKDYIRSTDDNWDVVLFNGKGESKFQAGTVQISRQFRKVKTKQDFFEVTNRQLSRANPESIIMPKEYKKLKPYEMRQKLVRPLLMLHALELKDENGKNIEAVGFGISFPVLKNSLKNTVKVKINPVYKKQLEDAYNEEDGEESYYEE
ncbi:Z1 domain-containing protein [Niallia taxi]|nr:Z1 domain-containing protein [Niallia taxi]MDE5052478.1 Z1 domain-containing protein [Niallia taxi]